MKGAYTDRTCYELECHVHGNLQDVNKVLGSKMARNMHCRTDMLTDSAERALHLLRNGTYTVGTHAVQLL